MKTMKKIFTSILSKSKVLAGVISKIFISAGIVLFLSGAGHFEGDLAKSNPKFDILDVYVFDAASKGNTAFIMTVNPAAESAATGTFGENGLYNFHISTDDGLSNGKTYTVQFTGGNVELAQLDTVNDALGSKGDVIGNGSTGQTVSLDSGVKLWTGVVKDPFFGNAAGLGAFKAALSEGKFDRDAYNNAEDFFNEAIVGAIVLEVPNNMLGDKVNYYATSAMQMGDNWIQINRAANVLMTHLFFIGNEQEVAKLNSSRPGIDKELISAVSENILSATTLAGSQDDPKAYAEQTANMLFPDVLSYEVGTPANYGPNVRNGRRPSDDGMNTVLSLFSGLAMDDKVDTSHNYQSAFPYVLPKN